MPASPVQLAQLCESLLEHVRQGRPDAWERMIQGFGPLVLAVARRAGLSAADVDDVFQATWVSLHRSLPGIREPGALAAWIGTTARRESWRVSRNRSREAALGQQEQALPGLDKSDDPQRTLETLERDRLVHRGLAELSPRCRELLDRLFFSSQSESYEDIASAMSMKVGSVGPTRIRCMAKLAEWLSEHGLQ